MAWRASRRYQNQRVNNEEQKSWTLIRASSLSKSKLTLLDRNLHLCHKLRLIATSLIFKVQFAIGATDVIAIGLNPFQNHIVRLLQAAKTAIMDHRSHRLHSREFH